MARYNHFSNLRFEQICFSEVAIGEKFRMDKFKGKRRRRDIICVKTGDRTYHEFKSKKEYELHHSAFDVFVFKPCGMAFLR